MVRKIGSIAPLIGLLILLAGCTTPGSSEKSIPPAKEMAGTAALSINPASGQGNANLEISGSGFLPGEKILLLLNAEGMVKGKSIGPLTIGLAAAKSGGVVIADEKGGFKLSRKYPVNIKPGVHTLEARGDKGSKATCPIEVLSK